ncbi:MAG: ABC transporter substrate-binding protein [Nitrososphaerota archaeon]
MVKEEKKINRRDYLKYTSAGIGGLIIGGALGYLLKPTEVVKETTTIVAPGTTVTIPGATVTIPGVTVTKTAPAETVIRTITERVTQTPEYKGKLTILGRDGYHQEVAMSIIKAYQAENPGVQVEYIPLGYSPLYDKIVISMKEKSEAYDVIMLDDPWAPEFMSSGWLENIEDLAKTYGLNLDLDDFIKPALDVCRYPYPTGTLYAVPWLGNVQMFAYRKDILEQIGAAAPTTWTEVKNIAKKIKEKVSGIYPIAFRGTKGNPIVTSFLPILYAFGGKVISDDLKSSAINTTESINALKYFISLKTEGLTPPGVETWGTPNVRDGLLNGEVAMAVEVWPGWIMYMDDPAKSKVPGKIEVMSHPREVKPGAPMLGVWLYGISKFSKNKELAVHFLQYSTKFLIQKFATLEKVFPPVRKSVFEDESVKARYRWYPAQYEALKNSVPRPRITKWAKVEDALGTILQLALVGQMSPEEAISTAHKQINEILAS